MSSVHVHLLLGPRQYEWLQAEARRRRLSLSALVRGILEEHVNGHAGADRELSDICGDLRGGGFSGRDHDRILYGGRKRR